MSTIRQRLTPSKLILNDNSLLNANANNTKKKIECNNHTGKKAKYFLSKDPFNYLCSKCAVSMVGKGFKVEELPGIEEDYRKEQINQFLKNANDSIPNIEKLSYALIAKREDIHKYYEQQKEKVEKFHKQIQACLEDEKIRILQELFLNFKQLSKSYDDSIQSIQQCKTEIVSMKNDIESNVDKIIKQIQNEPFNEIMTSYNKNISSFNEKSELILKTPIEVIKVSLNEPINVAHMFSLNILKTCLVKKNIKEKEIINQNDSMYVSFENKEQFTQQKIPKLGLPNVKTPRQDYSRVAPFEIKTEEIYEEGCSQMIERDDIENSYQMMILDNPSEDDEQENKEFDIVKSFGPTKINTNTPDSKKVIVSKIIQRQNDKNYLFRGINTSLKLN